MAINSNIVPITKHVIAAIVYGMEKYCVSVNRLTTFIEKNTPNTNNIEPGIPINFKGDLRAMISNNEFNNKGINKLFLLNFCMIYT